jgi:tripartite-type tricarboxylate transporter receptor subunit TctC
VIALLQRGMLLAKMTNPTGVRFDLSTLNWIGNLNSETSVVLAWHGAPHVRAADLFTTELIVGGTVGVDPETTAKMYNGLLGTKFKIVNGYKGTTDIGHAMETGEVQGIADWSWSTLKVSKADWLRDKTVRVLMQAAAERDPDLPDVPNAIEFAKDPTTRGALELYLSQKKVARPIAAPPGMPSENVAILRQALLAAGNDAELRQAVAISGTELNILSGDAVVAVIKQIQLAPNDVVQKLKDAIATR